ncbi:MAG: glycosyltransferase, partial [Gemmataceae bacterium]
MFRNPNRMTHPRSAPTIPRTGEPDGYASLLHELNQRYFQQWQRAEQLERELALTRGRLFGPLLAWMRWLKRRWRPSSPESHPGFPNCPRLEEVPDHVPGRISVVIPFRDRLELLRTCVRSLRRTTTEPIEIVLVDHESQDPITQRWLRKMETRPGVSVARETGPFNFSRRCNVGARRASGDFRLFLNNDTECLSHDWPQRFKRLAAQDRVGLVGALLVYPDQTVQHAGLFPRGDGRWVHAGRG